MDVEYVACQAGDKMIILQSKVRRWAVPRMEAGGEGLAELPWGRKEQSDLRNTWMLGTVQASPRLVTVNV